MYMALKELLGDQVGYEEGGKYYINNHLMFKILVHRTNGQYTRSRENMAELEAASIIEVGKPPRNEVCACPRTSWSYVKTQRPQCTKLQAAICCKCASPHAQI